MSERELSSLAWSAKELPRRASSPCGRKLLSSKLLRLRRGLLSPELSELVSAAPLMGRPMAAAAANSGTGANSGTDVPPLVLPRSGPRKPRTLRLTDAATVARRPLEDDSEDSRRGAAPSSLAAIDDRSLISSTCHHTRMLGARVVACAYACACACARARACAWLM